MVSVRWKVERDVGWPGLCVPLASGALSNTIYIYIYTMIWYDGCQMIAFKERYMNALAKYRGLGEREAD